MRTGDDNLNAFAIPVPVPLGSGGSRSLRRHGWGVGVGSDGRYRRGVGRSSAPVGGMERRARQRLAVAHGPGPVWGP